MFQFPALPYPYLLDSVRYDWTLLQPGSPIRTSTGQRICAPHRSFSQLVTSFFGSQCQGIHLMPFFAWPIEFLSVLLACHTWRSCMVFLAFVKEHTVTLFFSWLLGWNRRFIPFLLSLYLLIPFRYWSRSLTVMHFLQVIRFSRYILTSAEVNGGE